MNSKRYIVPAIAAPEMITAGMDFLKRKNVSISRQLLIELFTVMSASAPEPKIHDDLSLSLAFFSGRSQEEIEASGHVDTLVEVLKSSLSGDIQKRHTH